MIVALALVVGIVLGFMVGRFTTWGERHVAPPGPPHD